MVLIRPAAIASRRHNKCTRAGDGPSRGEENTIDCRCCSCCDGGSKSHSIRMSSTVDSAPDAAVLATKDSSRTLTRSSIRMDIGSSRRIQDILGVMEFKREALERRGFLIWC